MKTSNKILLGFCLLVLCMFGGVHLALYAKYKRGSISTVASAEESGVLLYSVKTPPVVHVEGNVNVNLVASDSFFIEYNKDEVKKELWPRMSSDTVVMRSADPDRLIASDPFQAYSNFPWITIHVSTRTRISLAWVLAVVKGPTSGGTDWDLEIFGTQLWFGDSFSQTSSALQLFGKVRVDARYSNLILNRQADIQELSLQLDANSEVNDHEAMIRQPMIQYSGKSKINLTGVNLDKVRGR